MASVTDQEAQAAAGQIRLRDNLLAVASVWDVLLAVAVAGGLYLVSAYLAVDRGRLLPLARARMVEMKTFLEHKAAAGEYGGVYFLGSSVLLEGVDCGIVDEALGGRNSYNLAWTGATARQWLLMLPRVRAARPSAVVLCVDLPALVAGSSIPGDLLTIAGWWELLSRQEVDRFRAVLRPKEAAEITAPKLKHLIDFRSFPLEAFEAYVREVSRPSLRYEGYERNFKAPWVRREVLAPEAMQREMRIRREDLDAWTAEDMAESVQTLEALIGYFADGAARIVIVLTPINPDLAPQIPNDLVPESRRVLAELAARTHAVFLDHSALLKADQFSDSVHPFTSGRAAWSRQLGRILRDLLGRPAQRN